MNRRSVPPLLILLAIGSAVGAAPDIIDLNVSRSGDDLVIDWTAAGPADGYRVYLSTDVCASATPVYDGPDPSFVAAGVLADPASEIYLVTTYVGADEGRPGPAVYKYGVDLPYGPLLTNLTLISLPWESALVNALDLCTDVNGGPLLNSPVLIVDWVSCQDRADRCGPWSKFCISPFTNFDLIPSEGYFFTADRLQTIVLWGRGPFGSWQIDSPAFDPAFGAGWRNVSLPYDHAYPDLAALADDFPEAVEIRVHDELNSCSCSPWDAWQKYGLTRPDTASPWSGDNYDLTTRAGQGVFIATETATTWVPRQRCPPATLAGRPRRVTGTTAVKSGDDVHLTWDVQLAAVGGYSVYRVPTKADLAAIDPAVDVPLIAVPEMRPPFPVGDPGAVPLPGLDIYRIIGRDRAGIPGDL